MVYVRSAQPEDAQKVSEILIRSISILCADEHQGDADLLSGWTGNKSITDVLDWLDGPHHLLVSEYDKQSCAVGMYSDKGEILLLYVDPDSCGQGHSTALLAYMESRLLQAGHEIISLASTQRAHGFYHKHGWSDGNVKNSAPETSCSACDVTCLPMYKILTPQSAIS